MKPNELPFVLYFDEIECGNPLGSHRGVHKLGTVYFSFRCLPRHMYSKLKNIFVIALFPSTERNCINVVLERLKEEIIYLQEHGVTINEKCIYLKFVGFLGDNLGLQQILGFTESFVSNYWCRICKMHRNDARESTKENIELLRNSFNYEEDLPKDLSESGISCSSVLNDIP